MGNRGVITENNELFRHFGGFPPGELYEHAVTVDHLINEAAITVEINGTPIDTIIIEY